MEIVEIYNLPFVDWTIPLSLSCVMYVGKRSPLNGRYIYKLFHRTSPLWWINGNTTRGSPLDCSPHEGNQHQDLGFTSQPHTKHGKTIYLVKAKKEKCGKAGVSENRASGFMFAFQRVFLWLS